MAFRRPLALILLLGFWLTLESRLEPHFDSSHSSLAFHSASIAHEHDDSSRAPSLPSGDHKDPHGCYHSHAPFVVVKTSFNCQPVSSMLMPSVVETPYSLALMSILRPPRA